MAQAVAGSDDICPEKCSAPREKHLALPAMSAKREHALVSYRTLAALHASCISALSGALWAAWHPHCCKQIQRLICRNADQHRCVLATAQPCSLRMPSTAAAHKPLCVWLLCLGSTAALKPSLAHATLILSSAAALKPSLAPPLQPAGGPHGLPLLPSGESLVLDAPGWTRGIGTGGRVWPASAALCRYLARTGAVRGKAVLELGCGTGATGLHCAAALNASSVILTEGGSEGLLQLARRNVEACVEIKQ